MAIQTILLAPIWNGTQFFDTAGNPLAGGKIGTFIAGSMTSQQTTYSNPAGSIANANPIILDSSGRVPVEMWLTAGSDYQFVLFKPDGETVIQACDNLKGIVSVVYDEIPDQTNNDGSYLSTDGTQLFWSDVLPDQTGQAGKVLSTDGSSITGNLSWVARSGGSAPTEYLTELSSGYPMYSNGDYYYNWLVYDQQVSPDVTSYSNGTAGSSLFTLNTPGSYRVTITGRIRSQNYPAGPLVADAMFYGIQLGGSAYANFNLSTHGFGEATTTGWPTIGTQNQIQWTDTFYVMMYDANPVSFSVGVYATTLNVDFQFYPACFMSIVRTNGTPIQPV